MHQESSSASSSFIINMENYSSPAQIRSSISNHMTPSPPHSIFNRSSNSSSPVTPPAKSDPISVAGGGKTVRSSSAAAISGLSRLVLEHGELQSLYSSCLAQLQRTFKESETLRQENADIQIANHELNLLIEASLQRRYQKAMFPDQSEQFNSTLPLSLVSERFNGLSISQKMGDRSGGWNDEGFSSDSPTSVIENNQSESQNVEGGRVTMPKSISVRSNAYLKMTRAAAGESAHNLGLARETTRIHAQNAAPKPQKVYIRGGKMKEGPMELDVYSQGVSKTELCNKWQETGACPYGDRCQFAHGIGELRPVIRHPRYKTELCRMILCGDPCPYGHRCHFRHALTEQEKHVIPLRQSRHLPVFE